MANRNDSENRSNSSSSSEPRNRPDTMNNPRQWGKNEDASFENRFDQRGQQNEWRQLDRGDAGQDRDLSGGYSGYERDDWRAGGNQREGSGQSGSNSGMRRPPFGNQQQYGNQQYGNQQSGSSQYGTSGQFGNDYQMNNEPRRGKSPKGYIRSDERIKEDVCDRIGHQHDASDVEVLVTGGEVTLTGTVADRMTKFHMEELVDRIPGVKELHNQIKVKRYGQNDSNDQKADSKTDLSDDANKRKPPGIH